MGVQTHDCLNWSSNVIIFLKINNLGFHDFSHEHRIIKFGDLVLTIFYHHSNSQALNKVER